MSTVPVAAPVAPPVPTDARRLDLAAGAFVLLCTLFRLWYAAHHELAQDEAYYWQWSRHLDWGYYDNTPLAALVIRAFTTLLGSTELGVRAGAIFSALIVSVFLYLLTKRLLDPAVALWAIVLANAIPLFAAGAIIMTHDPVQLALWAATLYVVHRALTDRPRWWYGAGVLAGLTAQAKLNGLLLLPGVFVYLLLSPSARAVWLRRPQPYLAGLIALVIFSPFIWWNHTHENAFWTHIGVMGSRSDSHDPPFKYLGNFLGAQAAILSPFVFLTYLYTLYAGWRRRVKDDAWLFLWCPSAVVFVATTLVSLRSKVEGNWAVAAYVTGMILVADVLYRAWQRGRGGRVWMGLNAAFAVLLAAVVLFPGLLYGLGVKLADPSQDRTTELYGWRQMGTRLAQERAAMGGDPFVFGVNYRMPSEAAFYLPDQPRTYSLFLHDRANEYMFWEDPAGLQGRDAVFVNDSQNPDHFDDLRAVFARVVPQPPLKIYRAPYTTPIRTLQIVRCYGFRGYDPHRWQQGW